jgi:hypothetical protein
MKYAVQIGSGAMIYVGSLIKIGSAVQKLMVGGGGFGGFRGMDTDTAW